MTTFESDLQAALNDMSAARATLVSVVCTVADADLDRVKRGGWPVHRVITHAIEHDYYMSMFVASARGQRAAMGDPACGGQPIDEILRRMEQGRNALISTIKDIAEDEFYSLQKLGHDEFSPITALENAAAHDREHAAQLTTILES
ncbi:MAG: DinB family protein [Dehalococcoidia bacterium]